MPDNINAECLCVFVSSGDIRDDQRVSGFVRVTSPSSGGVITREAAYSDLDRPRVKNHMKRVLYEVLSAVTGKELPWGTMTGIRPTKVPMKMIREGLSDELIRDHMKAVYLCSDEKISLATQIGSQTALKKTDFACISAFRSVPRPVCTVRSLHIRSYPGRSVRMNIFRQ